MSTPTAPPPVWKYVGWLAVPALVWGSLVVWLGVLLFTQHEPPPKDDEDVREWINETQSFIKTLPELVREYVRLQEAPPVGDHAVRLRNKREEIRAHLRALAEPTQIYTGRLPLFPVVYSLQVTFNGPHPVRVGWESPSPPPRQEKQTQVKELTIHPLGEGDDRAVITCEYRLHTWTVRHEQQERQRAADARAHATRRWSAAALFAASILGVAFVVWFLRRERDRELRQWRAAVAAEHRERDLLETRVKQQEAERATEDLGRRLLEGELEKAKIESRAAEAERAALEMKSQLYASIGIMAGSYAHNIKNLLVRPADLLTRCIEADGLSRNQEGMLQEVKSTLGTVTERLQEILRTVRRDPNKTEMTRIDLNSLVRESQRTWADMARDKWKLRLTAEPAAEPLVINGDLSHLQQAVENLVFNARDATFEMRNHLREEARRAGGDAASRKQKLIEAAAWKGEVTLSARREGSFVLLEVRDTGIGMTEVVRRECLKSHFTTKRDNALYEGYSAGMGLGLSFVAVVLEHHGAVLEIESAPLRGSLFRIRLPLAG